jgi:amino acid transporter
MDPSDCLEKIGSLTRTQMAEEVRNASVVIPRAIPLSVLINGALGFSMLIAVLFCLGDLDTALASPTGYLYMEILRQATNSISGALGMTSILLSIGICSVIGMLTATSHQFWSFARDRAVPGWRIWSKVCSPPYSRINITDMRSLPGLPW